MVASDLSRNTYKSSSNGKKLALGYAVVGCYTNNGEYKSVVGVWWWKKLVGWGKGR